MVQWDKDNGVVDETGKQVVQILLTSTKKERNYYGKLLAAAINEENEELYLINCPFIDIGGCQHNNNHQQKCFKKNCPLRKENQ